MSTELYPFSGNEQSSMVFTPLLDRSVYNCQIKWNIAGQRWYLEVSDNAGNRLLTTAMVASPIGSDINLISGVFFQSKMVWRQPNGQIEVMT
jgi:hypothetical protein